MEVVYLSLGSNQGNRIKYLQKSVEAIEVRIGEIIISSEYFETEPWGFITDSSFINQVICIKSNYSPEKILEKILDIEVQLGRIRMSDNQMYTNRCIDIDILFYGNEIIDSNDLIIPHKHLHERKFVLQPMNQIAGDFIHPIFKKSISDLLLKCEDKTFVKKYIAKQYSVQEI
jgi:2-amino-4-hydroxy-6-hydroxymethyldihydropteridine diphosphokinase